MQTSRGLLAYKAPSILARVAVEVEDPYRTLLLVHAALARMPREELAGVELREVRVEPDGRVFIREQVVAPPGVRHLLAYLRGYRAGVVSDFLFPLPLDPSRHANEVVAKRQLSRIVHGRAGASAGQ